MATHSLLECPLAARDYAFYKAKFAALQAESDAFDEEFGLPKVDRAYARTVERAQWRALKASGVTFAARVQGNRELSDYAAALGAGV